MSRKEFFIASGVMAAALFGILRVLSELKSLAATQPNAFEPESGTRTSGTSVVSNTAASGGKAVNLGTAPTPTPAPSNLIKFSDFGQPTPLSTSKYGMVIPAAGYIGAGIDAETIEMVALTSTKARQVPTQASASTNPFYLLATTDGGGTKGGAFSGFTVQGTNQNMLYNGIRFVNLSGHTVTDVRIKGCPGDANVNPGETFGVNDFSCNGGVYTRVEVDGRDLTGAAVGASGMATNSSSNVTYVDCYVHDHKWGMPTFWQTVNITTHNLRSINNRRGINHERASGVIRHYGPILQGVPALGPTGDSGLHISFNNDQVDAPDIEVHDPVWSGGRVEAGGCLAIGINNNYRGNQKQTTIPRFYQGGTRMLVADFNAGGAPRAAALADPKHSVMLFR